MWASRRCCGMFKDGGKGGKAEVGFPCFPRAGISTALLYCALAPFFCLSRVRRKRYDSVPVSRMCSVGDAIQQGFTKSGIRNHLRPFRER